jgi:hypothetical protein
MRYLLKNYLSKRRGYRKRRIKINNNLIIKKRNRRRKRINKIVILSDLRKHHY